MASSNDTTMDTPMNTPVNTPTDTPMDTAVQSTTDIALELIRELHAIKGQRYQWTLGIRDKMIDDWREHYQAFEVWFQKATDTIKKLKAEGSMSLAERLSTVILARPMIHDPANFVLSIPTGWGEEAFQIIGSSEVREAESRYTKYHPSTTSGDSELGDDVEYQVLRTQPGYCPQWPDWDMSQFLALAGPVDFDLGDNFEFELAPVDLHDATAQKLWITSTPSGLAFCLICDCPEMPHHIMPLGTAAAGSYNLIARHFHTDPFSNNFALTHMLQVHNETFKATPASMRTMIKKYGRQVDFPNNATPPDKWTLAMSNFAGQMWYEHLSSSWATMQEKYQLKGVRGADRGQRSHLRRIGAINRTIDVDALLNTAYIFQWPEAGPGFDNWVIICSHPNCEAPHFPHHPLLKGRAIEHFKLHGLFLNNEQEVLLLFGLKVLNIIPSPKPTEDTTQSTMQPSKKRERRTGSRPRLLNGRAVYSIWSYKALWDECVQRGIPLPSQTFHLKKSALEKRLRLHDGLEDYASSKKWPYKALQEECGRRGLPIVSLHGQNKYKRPDLIKMIESDEAKRRQESASAQDSGDHSTSDGDGNILDPVDDFSESADDSSATAGDSASVDDVSEVFHP